MAQPNALQVLKWLGIHEAIIKEGCQLDKMEISYPDLQPIKKIKNQVVADQYGNQTIAIHRWKLQKILYQQCEQLGLVKLGMDYVEHRLEDKKIKVKFKDSSLHTDVLLGADGIHSGVRNSMDIPSQFRYTNQICCRGIAQMNLPDALKHEGKELWGRKRRFGFSQLSDNAVYFFTVMNEELVSDTLNKETLSTLFEDFHPLVKEIIHASTDLHTTELMDLKRLDSWHKNQVCLLGDAAHATTPNMGQGACQGIEDAYSISQHLKAAKSPSDAFLSFEKARRKKVDYVVNNSWNFGRLAHQPVGQFILKTIMKMTPEKVMSNQMNTLYAVDGL